MNSIIITIVVTLLAAGSTFAGGAACSFKKNGLPLLEQSPALARFVSDNFAVNAGGILGPMDAPFDRGRLYTYMEFQASAVNDHNQQFIVRLHFKRKSRVRLVFDRAEFLPVKEKAAEGD